MHILWGSSGATLCSLSVGGGGGGRGSGARVHRWGILDKNAAKFYSFWGVIVINDFCSVL